MSEGLTELFSQHIERFNAGVRTGDFGPMVDHFDDDAVMVFEGVPAGPYKGRAGILEAYTSNPPDDEVDVTDVAELDDATVVGGYAWRRGGGKAGEMQMTVEDGLITHLVVSFEMG